MPVAFENDLGLSLSSSLAGDFILVVVVVDVVIVFNRFSRKISTAELRIGPARRVVDGSAPCTGEVAPLRPRSWLELAAAAAAADALVVREGGCKFPSRSRSDRASRVRREDSVRSRLLRLDITGRRVAGKSLLCGDRGEVNYCRYVVHIFFPSQALG